MRHHTAQGIICTRIFNITFLVTHQRYGNRHVAMREMREESIFIGKFSDRPSAGRMMRISQESLFKNKGSGYRVNLIYAPSFYCGQRLEPPISQCRNTAAITSSVRDACSFIGVFSPPGIIVVSHAFVKESPTMLLMNACYRVEIENTHGAFAGLRIAAGQLQLLQRAAARGRTAACCCRCQQYQANYLLGHEQRSPGWEANGRAYRTCAGTGLCIMRRGTFDLSGHGWLIFTGRGRRSISDSDVENRTASMCWRKFGIPCWVA